MLVAVFLVERDRVFVGRMTEVHGFRIQDEVDELVLIQRQDLVGELRFN
jgi:hypothetical protein